MRVMAREVLHQEVGQLHHSIPSSTISEMQGTKRQRRPSVRLGEIGDEPMPLVLHRLFKRRKPQRSPENAITPAVECIHPGLHGNVRGEDESTDDCSRPLARVHEDLKKRVKSRKHGKHKSVTNQFAVSPVPNDLEALKENCREVINCVDADEFYYVQTEQEVEHDLGKENDEGDSVRQQEEDEKLSSDGGFLHCKAAADPKKEDLQEGSMNQQPKQVRDSEINTFPHWGSVSAEHNGVIPKPNEDLAAISVDVKVPSLDCEVKRWLESLGLGKYASFFEVHEVDKDVLPLLTIEDLREMGVVAVGARRKLFIAIQALSCKES